MPTSIDELQIEINAKAVKANDAIDRLVGKLNGLTTSLGKLNTSSLNGLANGVQKLGNAMQVMNTVKTADFTRLARNLSSMGNINTQGLNNTASSLSQITRAMNNIGAVSHNAVQLSEMAKNLSKFGGANVQRATVNIPLLANELRKLMMTLSSAPNVSRNIIDMTNALANLSTQGGKVGSASRSIQRSLNGTHSSTVKASKGFNGLASAIGKFYASYFMVIRGVKGIWSSIESTADYIEAYNYFNVALGKIGSDWSHQFEQYGYENAEAYAESFNKRLSEGLKDLSGVQVSIGADGKGLLTETGLKNLGLNIQEVTQYASQLASVTNSVGQTGEVSLATANAFTKLGADMSSLFNVDYSSVMNNLQSGLIGQSRALYKYGIDITNATLQTYAYELGLSKAVSEMTQAEKMQLRMIAILDQSKISWGDLSNTINSPSNLMRIFKNNLKETGMMLGQLFIPMLSKVVPILNGVTIAFKRLLVNIASFMGVELDLDAFGQGYNDLEDDTGSLGDSYDDLAESIKVAKAQLLGFDEVNKLQDTSATATVDAEMGGIDLTDEILKATSDYEKIWQKAFDKMEVNSNKWADAIEKALSGIGDVFEDFAVGDFFKAGEDTSQLVIDFNKFIAKALKEIDWQAIGYNVGSFLKGIKWLDVFLSLEEILVSAWNGLWDAWFASLKESPFETLLLTSIALLKVDGIRNALITKLGTVSSTMSPLKIGVYTAITVLGIEIAKDLGAKIGDAITTEVNYEPYFEIRAEHEGNLQKITDKYTDLNNQIERYVTLSQNYENLSLEDKNWVKQMGEDLQDAGIVANIDAITGAWKGTREELERVIEKQMHYIRLQANEEYLVELYQKLNELERKRNAIHEKIANSSWIDALNPFSDIHGTEDELNDIAEEIDTIRELIKQAEQQSNYFENQLEEIGKTTEKIDYNFGPNWEDMDKETEEALDEYLASIGDANAQSNLKVNTIGVTNGVNSATRKLTQFKIDSEENGRVNLYLNSNGFINALNYAGGFMDSKVSLMNSKAVQLIVNSSTFEQAINNGVNLFDGKINQMNSKKVEPKLSNDEVEKGLSKTSSLFNSTINTLNSKNITPEINTDGAKKGIENVLKLYNDNLSNIKSTVEFETNEKSFKGLFSAIQEKLSKTKFQLEVENTAAQGLMMGISSIKQYKMGGFPEDGLFFANHNELVGGFSNGKTAVANNEQITQGIAQAVAPAVYNAVVSAMQSTQRGNSDVIVNIDGKQVFKAVQRQANDYTAQTGLSPFNI